jgi:hypothetical protein
MVKYEEGSSGWESESLSRVDLDKDIHFIYLIAVKFSSHRQAFMSKFFIVS